MSAAHNRQRLLVAGLHAISLALLALQIYVRRFPPTATAIPEAGSPEARWWGLWPITYAPPELFALGAGALALLVAALWLRELWPRPARGPDHAPHDERGISPWLLGLAALLLAAFFAFPIAHTRWGDAYIIAKSLAWPDAAARLTHSWQAPLDVWLHSRAWLLVQPYVEWDDAMPLYRWLSPAAGALYLAAILLLSRDLRCAVPSTPPWISFGLLASLGVIQLFFGYVENYSFAAAGILVYLWLGLAVARGERPLWQAATALALTNATHPSTVVLAPSLLVLAWAEIRRAQAQAAILQQNEGNKARRRIVLQVIVQLAAPMLTVAALTWLMMEAGGHGVHALLTTDRPGGGDARWLTPLWKTETQWEHYTLFSWPHLRDFLNEQLLVAPVVLPSLLWLLAARMWTVTDAQDAPDAPAQHAAGRFLLAAWLFYLLFVWLWNPDYGGQRDWDLFSLMAVPQTVFLVYLLPRRLISSRYATMGALPLIAAQAMHTAAWIYQNTLPWQWP